ncbi:MAG: hypothetical protein AAB365_03465 [Patescibacteria group bacterium]
MSINTFRNIVVSAFVFGLAIMAGSAIAEAATAKLSLVAPVTGSFTMGQTQSVKWSSANYQSPVVSIRLIRKVSSNPNRYELVRTIAESTANDGIASWVPSAVEVGINNISLEIGCKNTTTACQAGNSTGSSLAVLRSTLYSNTASAFHAIEAMNNK